MLILSRKRNEKIVIGSGPNKITIMLVDIRGEQAQVGIDAPRNVPVHRQEIFDQIEGVRAANGP
jgi:carbon storage regulator